MELSTQSFFGTILVNMVLYFELWLQLHSLQLKMESHCLMLNIMILLILKSFSDKNSPYTFHMNNSLRHIIYFEDSSTFQIIDD